MQTKSSITRTENILPTLALSKYLKEGKVQLCYSPINPDCSTGRMLSGSKNLTIWETNNLFITFDSASKKEIRQIRIKVHSYSCNFHNINELYLLTFLNMATDQFLSLGRYNINASFHTSGNVLELKSSTTVLISSKPVEKEFILGCAILIKVSGLHYGFFVIPHPRYPLIVTRQTHHPQPGALHPIQKCPPQPRILKRSCKALLSENIILSRKNKRTMVLNIADESKRTLITLRLSKFMIPLCLAGLEAQLLGIVVRKEKPQLEEQKDSLVLNIAEGKRTLIILEDELLRLLSESKGSLLDNIELLTTLQTSQATSAAIKVQLEDSVVTEVEIDTAREGYRPCAKRASILFFVLTDMARIDPMYQFSLDSYISLFNMSIDKSKKTEVLEDRIINLNDYHTYAVYRNTCRGLFELHKLLFSFHMCIKILDAEGKINYHEYMFMLKGGVVLNRDEQPDNPCPTWLPDSAWDNITEMDKLAGFHGVTDSFDQFPRDWKEWYLAEEPESLPLIDTAYNAERSRSNVRRATSRANHTDDQQETDNDNSRIGMAHLRSTVNQNEVDRQRMQRVRAHRSQQQRAREKEIDRFRKRNAPVNLERAAFSYDPEIDYSADKSN
ncbi:Dynein heavy chain 2, axonemal [Homalodisca vitripennis]|nr:Dynein heavy chain 2, axonemal [Homalodisca vitripennis]